jgi:CRP-like cAMP-binding protein
VTTSDDSSLSVGGTPPVAQARFLRDLSGDTRARLFREAIRCRFAAGEILNDPSQRAKTVGIVQEGVLRDYLIGSREREQTVTYLRAGDFLGAAHLFSAELTIATKCLTPVRFVRMSRDVIHRLMMDDPSVAVALARELAREHRAAVGELRLATFGTIREQLAYELLVRATSEHDTLSVTHRDLALSVGSVREVVGRALHELESAGALTYTQPGQLTVNRARLREIVAGVATSDEIYGEPEG